jgi:hypothetical protein
MMEFVNGKDYTNILWKIKFMFETTNQMMMMMMKMKMLVLMSLVKQIQTTNQSCKKTWQSVWIPQLDRWTHPHFPTQEIDCRRPHGETWFEPTEFCHGTEHQSYPKAPVPGGFLGKRSSKLVTSPKKT